MGLECSTPGAGSVSVHREGAIDAWPAVHVADAITVLNMHIPFPPNPLQIQVRAPLCCGASLMQLMLAMPAGARRKPQHLKVQTAHALTHASPSPSGSAPTPSANARTVRFHAAGEASAPTSPLASTSKLPAPFPSHGRCSSPIATSKRPHSALGARPHTSCGSSAEHHGSTISASSVCANPQQQLRQATSSGSHTHHPSSSCTTPCQQQQQPGTSQAHPSPESHIQQRPTTSCGTPVQPQRPATASRPRPQSAHVTGHRGPHGAAHGAHVTGASRPSSPWAPHVASFAQQPLAEAESHRVARQLMVASAPDRVVRQLAGV